MPQESAPDSPISRAAQSLLLQALDLLACPACLEPLRAETATLACTGCGRVYPVLDGIPILLVDRGTRGASS